MQFSLRLLALAVACAGLACVSLANADRFWADVCMAVATVVFLTSTLACVYSRGEKRAFVMGLCLFGWTYFGIRYLPDLPVEEGSSPVSVVDTGLRKLRSSLFREVLVKLSADGSFSDAPNGAKVRADERGGYSYAMPIRDSFYVVGHALFSMMFGVGGGMMSRCFYVMHHRKPKDDG